MREEQEEYERKARRIKRNKKKYGKKQKPIFKKTYKGTRKKYEIRAAMT